MQGLTIIETATMEKLLTEIQDLKETVLSAIAEAKDAKKPYLNSQEVMAMLDRGNTWLNDNKFAIGYSKKTGTLLFKRKDVEAFIESDYYKG
ncbi:hypothetical protein [Arcticibacter eurypsychrophilus]|uniref:hypothetical protein n=1 Tax=Arcticibacter eurypsychrophilus TaxID=1434752 RepID=UPI00084DE277|nr:hypothetical protein [Arcticibacter eurypsychrophilus]